MKPSAVLVRAFQIKIGKTIVRTIFAVAQHKGMSGSAIEPHIENIEHLVIGRRIDDAGQKAVLGAVFIPGVRAFDLEGLPSRGVRLSLTRASVEQIEAGVRVLGECAAELLQLQTPATPFV